MPYFQETTPEQEADIARQALASGDLAQAVYHIGTALGSDPTNKTWLSVLDDAIERAPDPLVLVRPDQSKADLITAATRAYILAAKEADYRVAIPLLIEVSARAPELRFLSWAEEWLGRPGAADGFDWELVSQDVIPGILHMARHLPPAMDEGDPRRATAVTAHQLCNTLLAQHGKQPTFLLASSVIARRAGQLNDGMSWAYHAFQAEGTWANAVGVACAYRDAERIDDTVSWYRHALQLDPDEGSPWLDIGDTYLDAKRYDEAIEAYEEVVRKTPDHSWAAPSIVYARYQKEGHPLDKNRLFELSQRSGRAWSLFCRIQEPYPYMYHLPAAADPSADAVRRAIRQLDHDPASIEGGSLDITVPFPESPSVLSGFYVWTHPRQIGLHLNLMVDGAQEPDPRQSKAPVDFTLWSYNGFSPQPAIDPPDPRIAEGISAIAQLPYNLELWEPAARALAGRSGPAWMKHIAAVMVHPPPLPDPSHDSLRWVQKVQIAAALVLAYLDTGWDESIRKRALYSLVLGPVDWAVDAGLVALAWLARQEPMLNNSIKAFLEWFESQVPKDGYTCFEYPLVCCRLAVGGMEDDARAALEARRVTIETTRSSNRLEEADETRGGLTLEAYAKQSVADPTNRVAEWDQRINDDPWVAEQFFALQNDARLATGGIEFNSHEGRIAEMIRTGHFDVEGAKVNAQAAAEKIAAGEGGEADPIVFPGQPIEKLSHYVHLMKRMQTGDMYGALAEFGLDMATYGSVAQAWGIKLAADPTLNAKFATLMEA